MADSPRCCRCGKTPAEVGEYISADLTPDECCRDEEGTYNAVTNTYACTPCYIKMGMPTAPYPGWKPKEALNGKA